MACVAYRHSSHNGLRPTRTAAQWSGAKSLRPEFNRTVYFVITDDVKYHSLAHSVLGEADTLFLPADDSVPLPVHLEDAKNPTEAERTFMDWFIFGEYAHVGVIPLGTNFGYSALSRACAGKANDMCERQSTPFTVAGGEQSSCLQRAKQESRFCPWHGV